MGPVTGRAFVVAVLIALSAAPADGARPARGVPRPEASRCFGAAARDPRHPCRDRRLRYAVAPSPGVAQITPNFPCTPIEKIGAGSAVDGALSPCAFGVPPSRAIATVALVGDSHAMAWRATVEVLAQTMGWRALALNRSHCPFSKAVRRLPGADRRGCERFKRRVLHWFKRHREVNTVFAVHQQGGTPVLAGPGQSQSAAEIAGYQQIWEALPASVSHIVVLRDNPGIRTGTFRCIRRAKRAHRAPGRTCALPREVVLRPDTARDAAAALGSKRVEIVDLTQYMCGARRCLPVVGGALVDKDSTHLALEFATTLGPFLVRRVRALMARW